MKTNKDYTVNYDDSIGEITIPKGTKLTHQTALGIDKNYHFVDDWKWYKPELKGFAREMHMLDLIHRGLNVPKEYVDYEVPKRIIKIKFEGVDYWNRPIYKHIDSKERFGDVNNLQSEGSVQLAFYKSKVKEKPNDYLEWFGSSFGCEPNGGLSDDIQLEIVD